MSLMDFSKIEQKIDKFVIQIVNLFSDDMIYSYEFSKRFIISDMMVNPDNFNDYHTNLEYIISKLIYCVQQGDANEFVSFVMHMTHLNEATLKLDEFNDAEKVEAITEFSGELYGFIEAYVEQNV